MKRLPVRVTDEADAEIQEAVSWYGERSKKVAEAYVDEVAHCLKLIGDFPNGAPLVHGRVRQLPLTGFPFVILYRVFKDHVAVLRLFHCSQNPRKKFKKRRT